MNKAKHGVDFDEAQEFWSDPNRIFAPTSAGPEPRFLAIGKIGDKVWKAVFTWRVDRVRIISVRRARKDEVERYEED
ncbi:MAG TPA: BrnT family toxin [Roseiarcus sp.]|nr:BrnT family toxin [Roseiarcus sp.]